VPRLVRTTKRQRRRSPVALTLTRAAAVVVVASLTTATDAFGRPQLPVPVRVVVPAIGVSAPVIPLAWNADGSMQVPASFSAAGWFQPGPEPGEPGAAVIAGHIASRRGPGVFYRLGALRRGAEIVVVLKDGSRKRFVVTGQKQVSKSRFPKRLVFKRTPSPTLRLITCGGAFNSATGHHVDNVIVFAALAHERTAR
jgi:sortase (surface protein transpeptidase)